MVHDCWSSSALSRSDVGIFKPRALAAATLMTTSNLAASSYLEIAGASDAQDLVDMSGGAAAPSMVRLGRSSTWPLSAQGALLSGVSRR